VTKIQLAPAILIIRSDGAVEPEWHETKFDLLLNDESQRHPSKSKHLQNQNLIHLVIPFEYTSKWKNITKNNVVALNI